MQNLAKFIRQKFGSTNFCCNFAHTYNKDTNFMDNLSFRARVIAMKVGEQITVPVSEVGYTTIRGYASDLGFAYNRKYSTRRNREERTYTITRQQ